MAYVWHLSKNWKPEWGGALYWCKHHHHVATHPASFNTLVLFRVTTSSSHFVTTVSPQHKGKRLTFNGWWNSSWVPSLDEAIEVLDSEERRRALTHKQLQAIRDLIDDPWQNVEAETKADIRTKIKVVMQELFPDGASAGQGFDNA